LTNSEIEIDVDEKNVCVLRSGASFYKINGLAAEEFPPLPKFEERKKVVLQQEKLKSMLRKTSFAISMDETRYVLNGVLFSLKEHKVNLVPRTGAGLW
jgi:DNA polymerase-3 subunit beta